MKIPAIGERIIDAAPVRVDPDGRALWVYRDGVYRPEAGTLGPLMAELLGDDWLPSYANGVRQWLTESQPKLPAADADPHPDLVNVANGMLCWRTGELLRHDPAWGSTAQSPWPWVPDADSPRIREAFAYMPPGVIDLLFEVAGYLLWGRNPYKKAILLHGPANTGKTTLLNIFTSLVGAENVSHQTLQAIADERFSRAELFGKQANIVGDLDARNVKSSDYFKMMVGGDMVSAERKGQHPFRFRCRAKLLFSANKLPGTRDQSDAWFTRFLVIPMTVAPKTEDPSLRDGLASDPGEMAGFLRLAVEGLRRVEARGKFPLVAAVVEAGAAYRDSADSVRAFFKDEDLWELDPGAAVPRAEVYATYQRWCTANGRGSLRASEMYERIHADGLCMGLTLGKNAKSVRMIRGALLIANPHYVRP